MRDKNRLWIAHNSLKLEWKYFIFVWKWYSFCLLALNCPENLQDSIAKSVFTQTTFDRRWTTDYWWLMEMHQCARPEVFATCKILDRKKYNQIKVLFLSRTRFFCQLRKIWTSSVFSLHIIKADELTVPNSTQETYKIFKEQLQRGKFVFIQSELSVETVLSHSNPYSLPIVRCTHFYMH